MEGGYRVDRGEVDRWRAGLRQQRDDGGGCATMRERWEVVESSGTYVDYSIFAWPCIFRTALSRSAGLSPGEGWDAITYCGWGAQLLKIKEQVLGISA